MAVNCSVRGVQFRAEAGGRSGGNQQGRSNQVLKRIGKEVVSSFLFFIMFVTDSSCI